MRGINNLTAFSSPTQRKYFLFPTVICTCIIFSFSVDSLSLSAAATEISQGNHHNITFVFPQRGPTLRPVSPTLSRLTADTRGKLRIPCVANYATVTHQVELYQFQGQGSGQTQTLPLIYYKDDDDDFEEIVIQKLEKVSSDRIVQAYNPGVGFEIIGAGKLVEKYRCVAPGVQVSFTVVNKEMVLELGFPFLELQEWTGRIDRGKKGVKSFYAGNHPLNNLQLKQTGVTNRTKDIYDNDRVLLVKCTHSAPFKWTTNYPPLQIKPLEMSRRKGEFSKEGDNRYESTFLIGPDSLKNSGRISCQSLGNESSSSQVHIFSNVGQVLASNSVSFEPIVFSLNRYHETKSKSSNNLSPDSTSTFAPLKFIPCTSNYAATSIKDIQLYKRGWTELKSSLVNVSDLSYSPREGFLVTDQLMPNSLFGSGSTFSPSQSSVVEFTCKTVRRKSNNIDEEMSASQSLSYVVLSPGVYEKAQTEVEISLNGSQVECKSFDLRILPCSSVFYCLSLQACLNPGKNCNALGLSIQVREKVKSPIQLLSPFGLAQCVHPLGWAVNRQLLFTGLDNRKYLFSKNDWPLDAIIRLDPVKPIFYIFNQSNGDLMGNRSNSQDFVCHHSTFVLMQDVQFLVKYQNGSVEIHAPTRNFESESNYTNDIHTNSSLRMTRSTLRLPLTLHMVKVRCTAPWFNSSSVKMSRAKSAVVSFVVRDVVPPSLSLIGSFHNKSDRDFELSGYYENPMSPNQQIYFAEHAENQSLTCVAQGDPVPLKITWKLPLSLQSGDVVTSDTVRIARSKSDLNLKSTLWFPRINYTLEGNYACLTKNVFGQIARLNFSITVFAPEMESTEQPDSNDLATGWHKLNGIEEKTKKSWLFPIVLGIVLSVTVMAIIFGLFILVLVQTMKPLTI